MAMVMVKCPNTGKPVPTGIGMSKESFASSTLESNSFSCPACGSMHTWSKRDAFLQE
jgi:endogenous inhibitor of DNA gyrase (YacG/DUF329 family)